MVEIEEVDNGFILTEHPVRCRKVFNTIEETMRWALLNLTGKCENFGGSSYAKLTIEYERKGSPDGK